MIFFFKSVVPSSTQSFMIFKVFLEISRTKNLQPDFQIAGTNVFRNLNTFQIIYQNYRWQGGGIQIISPPPLFFY